MERDRETSDQRPVMCVLSCKVREGAVLELLGVGCNNACLGTGQEKREEAVSNSSCLCAPGVNGFATRGAPVLPFLWNLLPVSNLVNQKGN